MNTEELLATIISLTERVEELEHWRTLRTGQQLFLPVDEVSKQALGVVLVGGFGSKGVTATIGSVPATVTKVPTGTFILNTPSGQFEVPYY